MSKATWVFLVTLSFLLSFNSFGQKPAQSNRVEFEATVSDSHFEVYPLPDSTLFVYAHNYSGLNPKETFTFTRYDQNLKAIWSGEIPLNDDYSLQHIYGDHNYIYVLFLTYKPWEFVLLKINNFNAA